MEKTGLNSKVENYTIIIFAILAAICVCLIAFFTERKYGIEETGLFNAVYMYVHYDKMSFPVYEWASSGAYDRLYNHPPTHYFLVGLLMKLGIGLYYAEAIPAVFFCLLSLVLICCSKFSNAVKLGLLIGLISLIGFMSSVSSTDYFFLLNYPASLDTPFSSFHRLTTYLKGPSPAPFPLSHLPDLSLVL